MRADLARWQFAFTSVNQFLFIPVTIGLAFLTALLQTAWYRGSRPEYLRLTRFFGTLLVERGQRTPGLRSRAQRPGAAAVLLPPRAARRAVAAGPGAAVAHRLASAVRDVKPAGQRRRCSMSVTSSPTTLPTCESVGQYPANQTSGRDSAPLAGIN